ncbi:MAG: hypothetical protein IGQ45_01325 [Cyanobacterium sp. T60_A2020_053]|nr:hypothetical protein [Cyanobacterium sp. T60_A2020_053]
MIIGGLYSFNNGENFINQHFQDEFKEVQDVIKNINALEHKTKTSKEQTMVGNMLYSPSSLNKSFKKKFSQRNWQSKKISCNYSQNYYTSHYKPSNLSTKSKSSPLDLFLAISCCGI